MSSKPLHEHDSDSSSDEENNDRNTTQRNEDSVQQNSIDGITEESQAWLSTNILKMNKNKRKESLIISLLKISLLQNFRIIGNADIHV